MELIDLVLLAPIVVLLFVAAARITLWVAMKLRSPSRPIPTPPVTNPGASIPILTPEDELAGRIRLGLRGMKKTE
jgi:hypothetical protein